LAEPKRTIEGYEEMYAVKLCGGEIILAENPTAEARYMVCDCNYHPLGIVEYNNALGNTDFVEAMKLFTHRISERIISLENERETRGIPLQTLTAADCQSIKDENLEGRVVVIKPEVLAPEYQSIDYQLALVTGGFGASPTARGRAVYCKDLIEGKTTQWSRSDIAGIMPPDRLPDWARVNLEALQKPAEKESVLEKIKQDREGKQNGEQTKPKTKKTKKDGPEL